MLPARIVLSALVEGRGLYADGDAAGEEVVVTHSPASITYS